MAGQSFMVALVHFLLVAAFCCFGDAQSTGFEVEGNWAPMTTKPKCASNSRFFDPVGLECLECPKGQRVDNSGLKCECEPGAIRKPAVGNNVGEYFTCESCTSNLLAISWDKSHCVPCDSSTGAKLNPKKGDCDCPTSSETLIERDATGLRLTNGKQCIRCPLKDSGHWQDTLPYQGGCFECPLLESATNLTMEYDSSTKRCMCPKGLPNSVSCTDADITKSALEKDFGVNLGLDSSVNYRVPESLVYLDRLVDEAAACKHYGNRTACTALANLCVLSLYDREAAACKIYQALVDLRDTTEYHLVEISPKVGWAETMPWLYYTGAASSYLDRTDLHTTVSFDTKAPTAAEVSSLRFIVSVTTLSGEWLGFHDVGNMLQLCGGRKADLAEWMRFGTYYVNTCKLPLLEAIDAARSSGLRNGQTLFFDMYLQDMPSSSSINKWPGHLYPIPIKVKNIRVNSILVNQNDAVTDDQLVRRFFIVDEHAGVVNDASASLAVTFASSIKIAIRIRTDEKNKIYPPSMDILYAQRDPSYVYPGMETCTFEVAYTMDNEKFWATWDILLILAMSASAFSWIYRMMQFTRRRQNQDFDASFISHAVAMAAGDLCTAITAILICCSGYWFLFFKAQADVYTMVPLDNDKQVQLFRLLLKVAAGGAAIRLVYTIYRQCNYDVFFIDWEKPRITISQSGKKTKAPVSSWRTILVANEWNELQTQRITSRDLTLFLMMFFLLGLEYESLGIIEPNLNMQKSYTNKIFSVLLRFALSVTMMIGIAFSQVAYKVVIHHNYVKNSLQQFVDLITLANTSIIILDDKCAGYYLHGRSLMPFTDCSMIELNQQLRKEHEMQVSPRGLVPSANRQELAENQTFELFISKELRATYEGKLLAQIDESSIRLRDGRGTNNRGAAELPHDSVVFAAEEIAEVFRALIASTEANAAKAVLERPFMERIMSMPPESLATHSGSQPIFYHDFSNTFSSVLYYGIEAQLLIFELLVFTAVDAEMKSFAIATFITWLAGCTISYVRSVFGEKNISRKSLIDGRFLI